ncbi:D-glycero-alpha-D-manno-heptose-1,7-bisphosphate 7-phosphatase [Nonomuraea gerenzanensis]|uniref:D,D-heptose 1,7-bisphosphate phosphatase n=1 Tax=Nonomuraea gerenzanensis TaxID=93944 RepID=A0A1M4EH14_9ACTN|nr:HAD-IIIA family hydrolase [Nonomuraea gerenzanensis]UBU09623.1 HAD-IIIA family hydrolase [Nonomuraea gerenzanensis]SBO98054.1 D-glycero-D-manno-heptose 1,7-bisphosphate phosphatase; Histidinol-phosphatase [Nonomuraea gerenzanensis]
MFEKRRPGAVLFDRDGTLIRDVPYNGDPDLVQPMPGALEALGRLRRADVPVAVVTNQSGVAKGLLSADEMDQVNAKVEELLGPFDAWAICVHDDADGCTCRKPAPGLVIRAAAVLDVSPRDCVVVGDIGRDMEAARAAGARGILVPTQETLREEIQQAAEVAEDLIDVVDRVLSDAEDPVPAAAAPWARAMGWSRW